MLPKQDFLILIRQLKKLGFRKLKDYYASEKWKLTKEWFFKNRPYRCYGCGESRKLVPHHRTYERLGEERLEDLAWLCRKCHSQVHNRMIDLKADTRIILQNGIEEKKWRKMVENNIRSKLHGLPARIVWKNNTPKVVPY